MSGYTHRERVLHKLTGAAYQATMCEEYELAIEIIAIGVTFWERTDPVGSRDYPEHSERVDNHPFDGIDEEVTAE